MNKRFYGILKESEFNRLSESAQMDRLIEVGVYEQKFVVQLSNEPTQIWPPKSPTLPEPTEVFCVELYAFFCNQYNSEILTSYYSHMETINEKLYGLNEGQQAKIALEAIKRLYNQQKSNAVRLIRTGVSSDGIQTVQNLSKIELLCMKQEAMRYELAISSIKLPYLFGKSEVFENLLDKDNNLKNEIIEFEWHIKCLMAINDQFHFDPTDSRTTAGVKKGLKDSQSTGKTLTEDIEKPNKKSVKIKRKSPIDKKPIDYLFKNVFK